MSLDVYVLDACLRHIWVDFNGKLIELDLHFKVPVGNEMHLMSIEEVKQFESFCRERDHSHDEHRSAVKIQAYQAFKDATGKEWDSGTRVKGRAKRGTATAKQEAAEARDAVHPRRARA